MDSRHPYGTQIQLKFHGKNIYKEINLKSVQHLNFLNNKADIN